MLRGDITRSETWCVFPCPALNCEQTKHNIMKFSVFCINWVPASLFRPWCRLLNMEAQQHLTHSCIFKINYRSHQCQSTVMKKQSAKKLKVHVSFIFSLQSDKCSASGSKDTAHSNHEVGPTASYNMMMTGSSTLGQSDPHICVKNWGLFTPQKTM